MKHTHPFNRSVVALLTALLLGVTLNASAQDRPSGAASGAGQAMAQAIPSSPLNDILNTYAAVRVSPASAAQRYAQLAAELKGRGLVYRWHRQEGGVLYDAWYSPEADLTVIVVQAAESEGVNLAAYPMPGKIGRQGELL